MGPKRKSQAQEPDCFAGGRQQSLVPSHEVAHGTRDPGGRFLLIGATCCAAIVGLSVASSCWRSGDGSKQKAEGEKQSPQAVKSAVALQESSAEPLALPVEPPTPPPEPAAPPPEPPTPLPDPAALPSEPSAPASEPSAALPGLPAARQVTAEDLNQEAVEAVSGVMRRFPHSADPISLMGNLYHRQGNTDKAIEYWERCLELDPNGADIYLAMSEIALKKGELERAETLARKALEIAPGWPGVHYGLASAMMLLGRPAEAVPLLEKELEISPEAVKARYLLGQAHFQLGDYEQAKQHYELVMESRPDHKNACYGLAIVYARLAEKDRAREYQEKFKRLRAEDLRTLIDKTKAYDDLATARRRLAETHTDIGGIYRKQGNASEAEQHWRRAATLDPQNTRCRELLADACWSSGRERDALQICEQLRAIDPENVTYCLNAGALNARLQQFDLAEKVLKKAIELAPQDSLGHEALARLYLHMNNRLPEARTLAETAVRLRPNVSNYALLSRTCDRSGDRAGAVSAMERAVALDPGSLKYQRILKVLRERK